jgi:hypothetical protein
MTAMLLFDREGFRYKFRWCERTPKFLSLKGVEMITYEKKVNGIKTMFYQRKGFKYANFMYERDWYKIDANLLEQVEELFDDETINDQPFNKYNQRSMVLYDEKNLHYFVRWNVHKPKYLSMNEAKVIQFEKMINGNKTMFYRRKNHKYSHFMYENHWYKIEFEKIKNVHTLFDQERVA